MDMIPYYENIMEYVERVKMKLKPKLLVIFGSIAKGDFGVGSDVDILIVSDLLPKNFQKRLKILFLLNDTFAPIEPVGYTSEEFKKMISKGHPTALDAIHDGITLHKDEKYEKEIRSLFKEVTGKVRREEFGWVKV